MTATHPNPRASLLSGLRTGGVRSSNVPHTAAPGGSFNVHRYPSVSHYDQFVEEPEEIDEIPDMQDISFSSRYNRVSQAPMTSAVDGPRFSYQQNSVPRIMNGGNPFGPDVGNSHAQMQAFQMQLMQMEIIRLQAQQYQAELMAQAQRQQQQQQQQQFSQGRRGIVNPPTTAGPYDVRFPSINSQRVNQADHLRSKLGILHADQPMTAALDGKFGSRKLGEDDAADLSQSLPNRTTIISGGTVLGSPMSNNMSTNMNSSSALPSKSDSATSWRRSGKNNSVLSSNRSATMPALVVAPTVRVTPPSPSSVTMPKLRPQPLRFNASVSQPLPVIAIDSSEVDADDASSSASSRSGGSPRTPSSNEIQIPLSPREEASKKLYEGLGIGRPVPVTVVSPPSIPSFRTVSQPTRQPRGPPSGTDELGPKNFATRIRRKAIGGLNLLLESRERRDVEVY